MSLKVVIMCNAFVRSFLCVSLESMDERLLNKFFLNFLGWIYGVSEFLEILET